MTFHNSIPKSLSHFQQKKKKKKEKGTKSKTKQKWPNVKGLPARLLIRDSGGRWGREDHHEPYNPCLHWSSSLLPERTVPPLASHHWAGSSRGCGPCGFIQDPWWLLPSVHLTLIHLLAVLTSRDQARQEGGHLALQWTLAVSPNPVGQSHH